MSISALFLIPVIVLAADDEGSSVSMYGPPVPVERDAPRYPRTEAAIGGEGWVVINYMVDTEGKVFDVEVIDSSGTEAFEEASLEVLEEWRYKPANDDNGKWSITLLKQGFSVQVEECYSPPQELKPHGNKKYAFFTFKNGQQYKVPESWGKCNLIVLGTANADFTVWRF